MERTKETEPVNSAFIHTHARLGAFVVALGLVFLLEMYLQTGWLNVVVLPLLGLLFLATSVLDRHLGWLIAGCLFLGLGAAVAAFFSVFLKWSLLERIGIALFAFGASWLLMVALSGLVLRRPTWWALVPGSVIAPVGLVFLATSLRVFDFALYLPLGLGLGLLAWGLAARLFGLIIPGSLLVGVAPGIYIAWGIPLETNYLARTGIMLVSFALGWALITLFSRRITYKFVWWPIIPGAVLAISGWGLYIGGNPGNAVAFISNTGSIGLVLFGLYLLLMKRGIQQ
ncbi:MAG TPA: hypothetical protein VLH85_03225 [Levilinea sp.]|nr:hypothetical protein [Levilinea sp.]